MSTDTQTLVDERPVTGWRRAVANGLSELLAPWVCAGVMPLLVGALTAATWWKGALLGLLTAGFSAGVPYLLILRGVRRGSLSDRHVSRRRDRPALLAVTVALVCVGLVVVHLLSAPAALIALIVAMIGCAVVGMVVSFWWKLSMHTVVLSGSVVALTAVVGPWTLAFSALVVAVAWARVTLKAHTAAQAGVGALLGGVLTAAIIQSV